MARRVARVAAGRRRRRPARATAPRALPSARGGEAARGPGEEFRVACVEAKGLEAPRAAAPEAPRDDAAAAAAAAAPPPPPADARPPPPPRARARERRRGRRRRRRRRGGGRRERARRGRAVPRRARRPAHRRDSSLSRARARALADEAQAVSLPRSLFSGATLSRAWRALGWWQVREGARAGRARGRAPLSEIPGAGRGGRCVPPTSRARARARPPRAMPSLARSERGRNVRALSLSRSLSLGLSARAQRAARSRSACCGRARSRPRRKNSRSS